MTTKNKTTVPSGAVWIWLRTQSARRFTVKEIAREQGGWVEQDLGRTLASMHYRNVHDDDAPFPGLVKVPGKKGVYIWTPGPASPREDRDLTKAGLTPLDEAIPGGPYVKVAARRLAPSGESRPSLRRGP